MMNMTEEELMTLNDICRESKDVFHRDELYVALVMKGYVFKSLGGDWRPTQAGLEANAKN